MKVVVTGGCGFIGSHLVPKLIDQQHDVVVIDNMVGSTPENLGHIASSSALRIVESDISEAGDWKSEFDGVDWVVHLAALTDIVQSVESPGDYLNVLVGGTYNVLEASRARSAKRFVYPSSAACYGNADEYPTPEDAPIRPQYPYALMKRMGEEMVIHWAQVYGLPAVSLRFFNLYGPRASAMFGLFVRLMAEGQPITVTGDGSQTRDFTHISDVTDAIIAALESDKSGEIYNIGSGTTVTVKHMAELIGGDIDYIPRRRGEMNVTFGDISKALRDLDWEPKIGVQEGVPMSLREMGL